MAKPSTADFKGVAKYKLWAYEKLLENFVNHNNKYEQCMPDLIEELNIEAPELVTPKQKGSRASHQ